LHLPHQRWILPCASPLALGWHDRSACHIFQRASLCRPRESGCQNCPNMHVVTIILWLASCPHVNGAVASCGTGSSRCLLYTYSPLIEKSRKSYSAARSSGPHILRVAEHLQARHNCCKIAAESPAPNPDGLNFTSASIHATYFASVGKR